MDLGDELSTRVDALMDGLVADLERLTAIPSVAFPGFPPEPVREAHDLLVDLLRGAAEVFVEVRTLAEPRHSGEFGGAAPDALLALLKALATLHDVHGDVAVEGLRREDWTGTTYTEEEFRSLAGVQEGMPLITHLESLRPFGIPPAVTPGDTGPGFEPATDGPAYRAARTALREGWGSEPAFVASGGSIPLVNGLAKAVPGSEVLLFGAQDGRCNLHAPNERVLFSELRSAVIAEAASLREYAKTYGDTATRADSAGGAA
ncbi:hypothetical protein [Streptomyces anulatus]|uniref:hypothetical protein n=1 Tax=Streptomyces anulatus TaxID=1892 RepID=UPI0033E7812C